METNGYYLIPNALTKEELDIGLSSIHNKKVNYFTMKNFIDNIYLKKLKANADFMSDPVYVKFRYSNNNNSTDASTFHGDTYNHTGSKILPIYTCLCYFDEAELEVIPGSHLYNNNNSNSIESYNKRIVLKIKPGDILFFHSNLHHRGINFKKTGDRRIIQIFDVFPNKKTYDEHKSKLVIVQSSSSLLVSYVINPVLHQISKYKDIIDSITFIHYILMYNDIHYKLGLIDLPPWEKANKYISYEPAKTISLNKITDSEITNINIFCDDSIAITSGSNFYFFILLFLLLFIYLIFFSSSFKTILKRTGKTIYKKMGKGT